MNNIVDEFNNLLDEFINKMKIQFPHEKNIKKYHSTFSMAKMYDKSIPIKIFMSSSSKFKNEIKNKDEEFFKNRKTFTNRLEHYSNITSEMGLINHWDNLDINSRNAIWEYIQTLYVMGEMYINDDISILKNFKGTYENINHDNVKNKIYDKQSFLDELNRIKN